VSKKEIFRDWDPHVAIVLWRFIIGETDILKLKIIRDLLNVAIECREEVSG
jgi:hypothetical protein